VDPTIHAILENARAKERATAKLQRAYDEGQARIRRAHAAWQAVQTYKGDAIPDSVTGPALHSCYAERIVALGQVLKSDGWQARLDAVEPGSDAKTYAVTMLRRAMDGDIDTVRTMVREAINTMFHLGLDADRWLREGLMYEVLDMQPAPEPPLGWEGQYPESVDTADDFIRWIDQESVVHELIKRGPAATPSDGRLVRNAFRLVQKLDLAGMPLEPLGPITLETELSILRNLRRICVSDRRNPAAAGPPADPIRELQDAVAALGSARQADEQRRAPERLVHSLRDAIRDKTNVPLDELAKMIGQFLQAVRAVGWGDRFERLKADAERRGAENADSWKRTIPVKQWEAALAIYQRCDEGNFQGAVDLMAKSEQAGKAATWDERKVYGGVVSLVRNTIPDALVAEPQHPPGTAEDDQVEGADSHTTLSKPDRKEAILLLREYLSQHPTDYNIRDAAAHVGRSTGYVSGLHAWMTRAPKQADTGKQPKPGKRERELTQKIIECKGIEADPSEMVSAREIGWQYLLKNATAEERNWLISQPPDKRTELIENALGQLEDELSP
jgi:hypothetical protein